MMYTYRNKKTGATFNTTCKCSGGNWEQVKGAKAKAQEPEKNSNPSDVEKVEEQKEKE